VKLNSLRQLASSASHQKMREAFKTIIRAGVPFGLLMGLFFTALSGRSKGMIIGLACGALFGGAMALFSLWMRSGFHQSSAELDGEPILKQGPANHFLGAEGVGGWLYLTDRRLLFQSHRFNLQKHMLSVPLGQIKGVQACATAGLIPNGLRIVTAEGEERFVVSGRRSWVEAVNRARELPT
jgi:hypothetical protein